MLQQDKLLGCIPLFPLEWPQQDLCSHINICLASNLISSPHAPEPWQDCTVAGAIMVPTWALEGARTQISTGPSSGFPVFL